MVDPGAAVARPGPNRGNAKHTAKTIRIVRMVPARASGGRCRMVSAPTPVPTLRADPFRTFPGPESRATRVDVHASGGATSWPVLAARVLLSPENSAAEEAGSGAVRSAIVTVPIGVGNSGDPLSDAGRDRSRIDIPCQCSEWIAPLRTPGDQRPGHRLPDPEVNRTHLPVAVIDRERRRRHGLMGHPGPVATARCLAAGSRGPRRPVLVEGSPTAVSIRAAALRRPGERP